MELTDILSKDSVIACPRVNNKHELLEILAEHAAPLTGQDYQLVLESLSSREALGSTGLGNGIAVPHGKLAGLNGVRAIFLRLGEPVDFDSVDDQPVDLVMMLLAPVGAGADHLKALSRVARLLRTESLVGDLRRCSDPERLYGLLTAPVAATYAA
jgi:nitrogen PTS system EIIA component